MLFLIFCHKKKGGMERYYNPVQRPLVDNRYMSSEEDESDSEGPGEEEVAADQAEVGEGEEMSGNVPAADPAPINIADIALQLERPIAHKNGRKRKPKTRGERKNNEGQRVGNKKTKRVAEDNKVKTLEEYAEMYRGEMLQVAGDRHGADTLWCAPCKKEFSWKADGKVKKSTLDNHMKSQTHRANLTKYREREQEDIGITSYLNSQSESKKNVEEDEQVFRFRAVVQWLKNGLPFTVFNDPDFRWLFEGRLVGRTSMETYIPAVLEKEKQRVRTAIEGKKVSVSPHIQYPQRASHELHLTSLLSSVVYL